MSKDMLNEINWSEQYLPGTTDNFASNELIAVEKDATVRHLTKARIPDITVPVRRGMWRLPEAVKQQNAE